MKLIDTSGVNYIFENSITVADVYYLVPDVNDEVILTELVHGRRVPAEIQNISDHDDFDEVLYIDKYNQMLNKYKHRSFYNMTGFGDVSILATIHTLLNAFEQQALTQLFSTAEPIMVFTGDTDLTAFIPIEFANKDVTVFPVASIR